MIQERERKYKDFVVKINKFLSKVDIFTCEQTIKTKNIYILPFICIEQMTNAKFIYVK